MTGLQAEAKRADSKEFSFEIRLEISGEVASSWDAFTQRCGASFRCSYRATRAWQLETHLIFTLRRYDILMVAEGVASKIGQFAIGFGRRSRVFGDALQLLPEHRSSWSLIMGHVLSKLGPGRYVYGSDWSLEIPRQAALEMLANVEIEQVRSGTLFAVDFANWRDWEHYYASISVNIRRNVKKASATFPNLQVSCRRKSSVILDVASAYRLRSAMFKRKAIDVSASRMIFRSLARSLTLLDYTYSARATSSSRGISRRTTLSAFSGVQFGLATYYLESASIEACGGAAWHLLLSMIFRAYENSDGTGFFVMGPDHRDQLRAKAWEGLRRQRLQCRATPFPSSIVTFSYKGGEVFDLTPTGGRAEPGLRG